MTLCSQGRITPWDTTSHAVIVVISTSRINQGAMRDAQGIRGGNLLRLNINKDSSWDLHWAPIYGLVLIFIY